MTSAELLDVLSSRPDDPLHVMLPDGGFVPPHFHVTEVGRVQKDFIDCGGTRRSSTTCQLQLWVADDTHHRLTAGKLAGILRKAQPILGASPLPVEVEHEGASLSQYPVAEARATPSGLVLILGGKHADCLAREVCLPQAACCSTPGCC
jgi:hypothetical protein